MTLNPFHVIDCRSILKHTIQCIYKYPLKSSKVCISKTKSLYEIKSFLLKEMKGKSAHINNKYKHNSLSKIKSIFVKNGLDLGRKKCAFARKNVTKIMSPTEKLSPFLSKKR